MDELMIKDIVDKIEKRVKVLENISPYDLRVKELNALLGWILCDDEYPMPEDMCDFQNNGIVESSDEPTEEQLRIWNEYIERQRAQNPLFFRHLDEVSKK